MLLTDLIPDLVLYVPGCPEPTMVRALRDAARRFCRDTYVITTLTDPAPTVVDESLVDLNDFADGQTEVIAVLDMMVDGEASASTPRDWLRNRYPRYINRSGRPTAAYLEGETRLRLWPTPDAVYELQFVVATAPKATATQIDDDLGNRWKEAVIGKATFILASQSGVSYTSADNALLGAQMYARGVGQGRIELNRSFGRSTAVVQRGRDWV